ncbi:hypothetical protein D3C75_726830 [compost metagenome]
MSKRRTKEEIKADNELLDRIIRHLDGNPEAVVRAIILIGDAQTQDEQEHHAALQHNGVGWSMMDANFGTFLHSVAKQQGKFHGKLLDQARTLAKKYAKTQLFAHAKAKRAREAK